jgi:hypothetical protein
MRAPFVAALVDAVPFAPSDTFKVIEIGPGDAALSGSLREKFPGASIFTTGDADVASLTWWDLVFGAGLVVSPQQLDRLNDAKRQYLFKAVAERLSDHGALILGEHLQPQTLLHHLMWLRHAGFAAVDCYWLSEGDAVFGGVKRAAASAPPLRADN